jgi:hypothetical protein
MRKKIKPIYTEKTALAELGVLRKRYVMNEKGHQRRLRSILQHAQHILAKLRRSEQMRHRFLKQVRKNRQNGHTRSGALNLATEVLTKITGGTSRDGRQRAWKYGKVLDVLAEEGVPPEKTAHAIKSRGGIEKISGGTRGDRPPVRKAPEITKAATPQLAPQHVDLKVGSGQNDREILCNIYMRLSDRDKISDHPVGTTVILETIRIGQPQADLRIRRISNVSGSDDEEEEED